jgi:hypothetical protein
VGLACGLFPLSIDSCFWGLKAKDNVNRGCNKYTDRLRMDCSIGTRSKRKEREASSRKVLSEVSFCEGEFGEQQPIIGARVGSLLHMAGREADQISDPSCSPVSLLIGHAARTATLILAEQSRRSLNPCALFQCRKCSYPSRWK